MGPARRRHGPCVRAPRWSGPAIPPAAGRNLGVCVCGPDRGDAVHILVVCRAADADLPAGAAHGGTATGGARTGLAVASDSALGLVDRGPGAGRPLSAALRRRRPRRPAPPRLPSGSRHLVAALHRRHGPYGAHASLPPGGAPVTLVAVGLVLIIMAGVAAAALSRRPPAGEVVFRALFGTGCVVGAAPALAVLA